jgi:hypothetical protein
MSVLVSSYSHLLAVICIIRAIYSSMRVLLEPLYPITSSAKTGANATINQYVLISSQHMGIRCLKFIFYGVYYANTFLHIMKSDHDHNPTFYNIGATARYAVRICATLSNLVFAPTLLFTNLEIFQLLWLWNCMNAGNPHSSYLCCDKSS